MIETTGTGFVDGERIGVYATICFDTGASVPREQTLIGIGTRNDDGSFDVDIHLWPTNIERLQIRTFRSSEEAVSHGKTNRRDATGNTK